MQAPVCTHRLAHPHAITDKVWQWLDDIPDPEIPVISVIDLGIIRAVDWAGATCIVTVTPTYSGCPAMPQISEQIRDALAAHGLDVEVRTQLAPAWTTDWMTERGKARLAGYGIAPPAQKVIDISGITRRRAVPAPEVACPHCGSLHTRVASQFGSTACKALYRCDDCHEPFDYFKAH